MSNTPEAFVIIEATDWDEWPGCFGGACHSIPADHRPTVLHVERSVAEREALRLAGLHPGKLFILFEAKQACRTLKVPTHVTLSGKVVAERDMPTISSIDDDGGVPF